MSILLRNPTKKKGIVKDGLVLHYVGSDFRNSPPTTKWVDRSNDTHVNDATVSGFAYTAVSGSNNSGGVVFDGVDDNCYIIPANASFGSLPRTIEILVSLSKYPNSTTAYMVYGKSTGDFGIGSEPTNVVSFIANSSTKYLSSYIPPLNTKILLSCTYDANSRLKLYANGNVILNQVIPALSTLSGYLVVGAIYTPVYINYTVYDVKIYNKALTDAEIMQNYNASK